MLKKSILFILTLIMLVNNFCFATSAAMAETAESQFSEDFEKYQILDNDNDGKYYTNNGAGGNDVINCGKPADGNYSDLNVYPYGTASVYEGNADNFLMYVKDYKGKNIYGGLDGWYGYYNGGGQQYNKWNRRLSVVKKETDSNKSQYLYMSPVASADGTVAAALFSRNDVALNGYSYLTTRISFDSGDSIFHRAGIRFTVNPENHTFERSFDAVHFEESETEGKLDAYFSGRKIGEVVKSTNEKWYTIQYRIYNGGASAKHRIKIIDDENNSCIVDTNWQDINTEINFFSVKNKFGIMYYVQSTLDEKSIVKLDDIRFENNGYKEDFENYSVNKYYNAKNGVLSNAPKGNLNLDEYKNGVFEGNMALNNYTIRTLDENTTARVYGNIPSWQGYVSEVAPGINTYITDKWKDTCTVVAAADRYEVKGAGFNQALILNPKTTEKLTTAQSVYAGMEDVDFEGITTIKTTFNIYNANTDNGMLKLQLTNGRSDEKAYSQNASYASLAYDGNSFDAIYEPLKFEKGFIYFGGKNVGAYNTKTTYYLEYSVDSENLVHNIKISNKTDGSQVVEVSEKITDAGEFSFNGIAGFRYVASTEDYIDAKTENKVLIDEVEIVNKLKDSITGVPETLNLTVNTNNTVKNIAKEMYGVNFEWGGYPSRYLLNDTTTINPEFTKCFEDDIPLSRMAGVSANWMLWKEAIGELSERSALYFWHYDARKQNYGPVEWINSIKQCNKDGKFIYTVNMPRSRPTDDRIVGLIGKKINQIDTLENLKDLVRFMTLTPDDPKAIGSDGVNWAQIRVELGIKEPVNIYAWELGCELDTDGQGWYRVTEYIEMCKNAISAIREIDPDAKIAAHEKTSIFYDENITRSWHKQLLKAIGNDIDYLSVHYYYDADSWDKFEKYFDTLIGDIENTPAKGKVKILLTEHSSARYNSEPTAGYDFVYPHTMRGTLTTAEYLINIMQIPEIVAANYHSIQSSSWALMYDDNGKYKKTAPGYLLELMGQKGIGNSVECTIDKSFNGSKISAGAIKKKNGLNLFLVNTSNDFDTTLNINIDGNYRLNKQTVITADRYDCDIYNDTDEINIISENKDAKINSFVLNKRSIVLLEFTDNGSIISVDKTNGNVEFNHSEFDVDTNIICASYEGDKCLQVKIINDNSGVINMGESLKKASELKFLIWNLRTLCPMDRESVYVLN